MAEGEKIIGIDLGTTNSVVAVMEGGDVDGHRQPGGEPADAVGRRVHAEGRDPRRRAGQAAGGDQPDGDGLLDQAVHGPPARRGPGRREDGPLRGRRRGQRLRQGQGRRQGVHAAGNLGADPPQAQGGGRELPRATRSARRSSPSRPTSTTASARRPRTPARSPAWRSRGSSTSRPPRPWPTGSTRRRTRRSPSSTSAAAPSTSRSSTSATASSRSSRPTATPTSAATTGTRR